MALLNERFGVSPPAGDLFGVSPAPLAAFPTVVVVDRVYHLQLTPELAVPMLQHGAPLRHLGDGWHFHSLYTAFAPVLLFELEHTSGQRATWFFDFTPAFLGHTVENLPVGYRKVLVNKASLLLNNLLAPVLGHERHGDDEDIRQFFGLSEGTRLQIGEACCAQLLPAADIVLAPELPEVMLARPRGPSSPVAVISRKTLAKSMTEDFQKRLIAAVLDGHLSWPSVTDGSYQPSSGSLCFDHFAYAFRMEDSATGLIYFLLASEHHARFLGLYFPSEGLVVAVDEWGRESIKQTFPNLNRMVMNFLCKYGDTLLPYLLRAGPKQIAGSMRESHLGHHLWNELSGVEAIVTSAPAKYLPALFCLGGSVNAFFGPLDVLFPALAGKVHSELASERDIVEYAHRHDLALARFTRKFVSRGLRNRIMAFLRETVDFQRVETRRRSMPGPLVLIGLRVENRTVVGLGDFLCRLVAHIAGVAPGVTIVLDGQNRRDDKTPLGSFADFLASRSPLEVEFEICQQVIASAIGKPVTVITTTGESVASSVAWVNAAECFISLWGAGLAKYRWIANKPGLILSSRFHLLNPGEMSIYHTPTTMEDPTPVTYVDPVCVHDDPDAPQLIPIAGPRFFSFRVNEDIFFPQVTGFLAPFLDPELIP